MRTSPTSSAGGEGASPLARKLGLTPRVEQRALYRDRICLNSFGMSKSDSMVDVDGLLRGN